MEEVELSTINSPASNFTRELSGQGTDLVGLNFEQQIMRKLTYFFLNEVGLIKTGRQSLVGEQIFFDLLDYFTLPGNCRATEKPEYELLCEHRAATQELKQNQLEIYHLSLVLDIVKRLEVEYKADEPKSSDKDYVEKCKDPKLMQRLVDKSGKHLEKLPGENKRKLEEKIYARAFSSRIPLKGNEERICYVPIIEERSGERILLLEESSYEFSQEESIVYCMAERGVDESDVVKKVWPELSDSVRLQLGNEIFQYLRCFKHQIDGGDGRTSLEGNQAKVVAELFVNPEEILFVFGRIDKMEAILALEGPSLMEELKEFCMDARTFGWLQDLCTSDELLRRLKKCTKTDASMSKIMERFRGNNPYEIRLILKTILVYCLEKEGPLLCSERTICHEYLESYDKNPNQWFGKTTLDCYKRRGGDARKGKLQWFRERDLSESRKEFQKLLSGQCRQGYSDKIFLQTFNANVEQLSDEEFLACYAKATGTCLNTLTLLDVFRSPKKKGAQGKTQIGRLAQSQLIIKGQKLLHVVCRDGVYKELLPLNDQFDVFAKRFFEGICREVKSRVLYIEGFLPDDDSDMSDDRSRASAAAVVSSGSVRFGEDFDEQTLDSEEGLSWRGGLSSRDRESSVEMESSLSSSRPSTPFGGRHKRRDYHHMITKGLRALVDKVEEELKKLTKDIAELRIRRYQLFQQLYVAEQTKMMMKKKKLSPDASTSLESKILDPLTGELAIEGEAKRKLEGLVHRFKMNIDDIQDEHLNTLLAVILQRDLPTEFLDKFLKLEKSPSFFIQNEKGKTPLNCLREDVSENHKRPKDDKKRISSIARFILCTTYLLSNFRFELEPREAMEDLATLRKLGERAYILVENLLTYVGGKHKCDLTKEPKFFLFFPRALNRNKMLVGFLDALETHLPDRAYEALWDELQRILKDAELGFLGKFGSQLVELVEDFTNSSSEVVRSPYLPHEIDGFRETRYMLGNGYVVKVPNGSEVVKKEKLNTEPLEEVAVLKRQNAEQQQMLEAHDKKLGALEAMLAVMSDRMQFVVQGEQKNKEANGAEEVKSLVQQRQQNNFSGPLNQHGLYSGDNIRNSNLAPDKAGNAGEAVGISETSSHTSPPSGRLF